MALFFLNKNKDVSAGYASLTDEQLIVKYVSLSDNECIQELFDRYTHLVYGICMKYLENEEEAKDAVMEIFEDLFDLLKEHKIANFKSWLHTVARNFSLMRLRKRKTHERFENQEITESSMGFMENGHSEHQIEAMHSKLHNAIVQLCVEQRKCIELMYLSDKSYKEIVDITGYDLKKVKSYIQNGKRNLKIFLMNE